MRREKGFTLVEIMAVMAIILILIGFLMPAITSARRQARKTECMSNLRQIGIAMQSYAMDNGGYFPASFPAPIVAYFDTGVVPYCPEVGTKGSGDGYQLVAGMGGLLVEVCSSNSPLIEDSASRHVGSTKNAVYPDGHTAVQ